MSIPNQVSELAEQQLGVVSRRQLTDAGVTPGQLRWSLGRTWRLVLPGVVMLGSGLPTDQQRLVAAVLFAGPDSWLGGETAAALHGIPGCSVKPPIQVRVPPHRSSRTVMWVRVSRSYLLDERLASRGPVRISCRPRALVDAAAAWPDEEGARALVIQAVQERTVRLDDVAHWVEARSNIGRRRLRRALAEAAIGAWSVPEADLLRLLATSRVLPPAMANPSLTDASGARLTTPDAWIDDVALAVMVHSRRFHAGVLDWDETVAQDDDLRAEHVDVIGVTPGALARDPLRVLRRVEAAYRIARDWPRPRSVVATPQEIWRTGQGPSQAP